MMSACLENQPNSCNKVCTRSLTPTDFNGAVFTHEIFALCGFYVILIPLLMYILIYFGWLVYVEFSHTQNTCEPRTRCN